MTDELMLQLVSAGANLILNTAISDSQLQELARISKLSGAHITVNFPISDDMYLKVAAVAKNHVTFQVQDR
jgi:hypothetical protein